MSSRQARDAIINAVETAASPLDVFNLSNYVSLEDCLGEIDSEAVLVQFNAASEEMVTIGGHGNQGFEETGSVAVIYVVPTGFDSNPVVDKGDEIREELRGSRLTENDIMETIDPFVDMPAGLYGGRLHAWATNLFYSKHDCG